MRRLTTIGLGMLIAVTLAALAVRSMPACEPRVVVDVPTLDHLGALISAIDASGATRNVDVLVDWIEHEVVPLHPDVQVHVVAQNGSPALVYAGSAARLPAARAWLKERVRGVVKPPRCHDFASGVRDLLKSVPAGGASRLVLVAQGGQSVVERRGRCSGAKPLWDALPQAALTQTAGMTILHLGALEKRMWTASAAGRGAPAHHVQACMAGEVCSLPVRRRTTTCALGAEGIEDAMEFVLALLEHAGDGAIARTSWTAISLFPVVAGLVALVRRRRRSPSGRATVELRS